MDKQIVAHNSAAQWLINNKYKHWMGCWKGIVFLFSDKPLKPSDLIQKSATSVSMLIGFTPGFDGGSTQSFKMNYTEIKNSTNIWSKNSTKREIYIKNLKPGTEYKITLQSSNKYGKSDPISKTFKTKSK